MLPTQKVSFVTKYNRTKQAEDYTNESNTYTFDRPSNFQVIYKV